MKKIYIILILIVFNFLLLYMKIESANIDNIKVKLKNNELGIVIITLDNSNSLLIMKDDIKVLYILDYIDDLDLYDTVSLFTEEIDYVITNSPYNTNYKNEIVLDNILIINGIEISKNKIVYLDHNFCINQMNLCDYSYITTDLDVSDNIKVLLYNESLDQDYITSIQDKWIDSYKVTRSSYTIITLGDNYEITNLLK